MPIGVSSRATNASVARTFFACASFGSAGRPAPYFLKRGLGVAASRNRVDVGDRNAARTRKLGNVEALADGHIGNLGIRGCDQYQPVAEQVDAGIRLDELPFADIVHPLQIRRNKYVSRRALFDLFGEC